VHLAPHLYVRCREQEVVADAQPQAALRRKIDDRAAGLAADAHRFLEQHMFAGLEQLARGVEVQRGRQQHVHAVDLGCAKLVDAREGVLDAVRLGRALRSAARQVTHRI
jgi:hypothetical protein